MARSTIEILEELLEALKAKDEVPEDIADLLGPVENVSTTIQEPVLSFTRGSNPSIIRHMNRQAFGARSRSKARRNKNAFPQ